MAPCEYCEIQERKEGIIFQDDDIVIAVKDKVITPGQMTVFPKEHFTILEQVPENIFVKCAVMANKVSIAAFECLGAQGTNLLVRNGLGAWQNVPHFSIEIIPRTEKDNLNLQWQGKPLAEDETETTLKVIKDQLESFSKEETEKKEEKKKSTENTDEAAKPKGENYLLKSLKRIP
ncbi:HIT family protein [Candidatus Woesearchaeota archaeon]|nr:HIT family protein [Candidatus Woesearchaeota archaeon]